MDFLRFGYVAQMRTTYGLPPSEVVWFPAAPGAKLFEGPTVFGSRNWQKEHDEYSGIGEQEGPLCCGRRDVVWYSGRAPAIYPGLLYCGSPHAAASGGVIGQDPQFWTNALGAAPCCATPFGFMSGGESEGGQWIPELPSLMRGGEAEGGQWEPVSAQLIVCMCGGEAEGGLWIPYFLRPTMSGGEAEGGQWVSTTPAVVPLSGGEAEGGEMSPLPLHATSGGEAEGGELVPIGPVVPHATSGGEAEGGELVPIGPVVPHATSGGEAEGGNLTTLVPTTHPTSGGESEGGQVTPYLFVTHVVTITTTGAGTFLVPANVTKLKVECWAGGNGGSGGGTRDGGASGGGGAYARKNALTVTPGATLNYSVGTPGSAGAGQSIATPVKNNGGSGDTWFSTTGTVLAKGCPAASSAGGLAASSVGDAVFGGGNGATPGAFTGGGAGGGAAASSAATGANGSVGAGLSGGVGGTGAGGGGSGGHGGDQTTNAGITAGSSPGGGGGGGGIKTGTGNVGAAGAGGKIIITYAGPP
jgi:hypothetical protein